jgi:cell division protein FtsB
MTQADARTVFESFKSAKADPALTNQQIVTRYNKLYEQERQLRKAGEAQKKLQELEAENARLRAQVDNKKSTGKTA